MKRFAKGAVVLATIPLLLVGFASAALAGGAAHGSGVSTMRPFNDGNWTPGGYQSGVSTMRPFNDGSWTPGGDQPGVSTMEPFSNPDYPISAQQPNVTTMRPFSDPNYPILAQPAARGVQPESPSSSLPLVALVAGLTALVAAAGALLTIGWRRRLRPA